MADMRRRPAHESGFVTMIVIILMIILAVMVLTYMRVKSVQ